MPDSVGWTLETFKELYDRESALRDRMDIIRDTASKEAISVAISAAKAANDAAFASAEKALVLAKQVSDAAADKLSEALATYKANANEWQHTFREFQETTLPRGETLATFRELRTVIDKNTEEINLLMRGESRGAGGVDAMAKARQQTNWVIGISIAICGMFISAVIGSLGVLAGLIYFVVGRH